ncbi:MAG TPA: hypothetical protein VNT99_01790 [Methylomirabilota bacterium]|nr:hypothetical protein [Methylomirabilota bacterium]
MLKKLFYLFLVLLSAVPVANSFSLLGPGDAEGNAAKVWQSRGANNNWNIGYAFPGDIGAPVFADEFYRWNVPVITYAFHSSFIVFFGTNGMKAIDEAFQILNDLPAASKMSDDLSEYPLTTVRRNEDARALGLLDIKSVAMTFILEELGLAQADRWVWSLHHREPLPGPGGFGEYDVINAHNLDPVTAIPSRYVNETLYSYQILEVPPPGAFTPYSDAAEFPLVPPGTVPNFPVTSLTAAFTPGNFFSGLTRDDVGGLRYLWRPRTLAAETLLPGALPGSPRGWNPFLGTNFLGTNGVIGTNATNALLTAGVRGGVNKVTFRKVYYDSLFGGTFTPITNRYADRIMAGNTGRFVDQIVLRPIATPDFIFTAEDINQNTIVRSTTATWINNTALTPPVVAGGPGIISPPVVIGFNKIFPIFVNQTPFFVNGFDFSGVFGGLFQGYIWASYDGTTNDPIIYPQTFQYSYRNLLNAARSQGGF